MFKSPTCHFELLPGVPLISPALHWYLLRALETPKMMTTASGLLHSNVTLGEAGTPWSLLNILEQSAQRLIPRKRDQLWLHWDLGAEAELLFLCIH